MTIIIVVTLTFFILLATDRMIYYIFMSSLHYSRGPLNLMSTIEELLERKSSGSGLENRDYGHRGSAALTMRHPSIQKTLALTSPTNGGRLVSIVRSRNQATEKSESMWSLIDFSVFIKYLHFEYDIN
jgi:hypothetical protein